MYNATIRRHEKFSLYEIFTLFSAMEFCYIPNVKRHCIFVCLKVCETVKSWKRLANVRNYCNRN